MEILLSFENKADVLVYSKISNSSTIVPDNNT